MMRKYPNWAKGSILKITLVEMVSRALTKALKPESIKAGFANIGLHPLNKRVVKSKLGIDMVYNIGITSAEQDDEVEMTSLAEREEDDHRNQVQSPICNLFPQLGFPPISSPIPSLFPELHLASSPTINLLPHGRLSLFDSPLTHAREESNLNINSLDEDSEALTQSLLHLSISDKELDILGTQGSTPIDLTLNNSRSADDNHFSYS